MEPGTRHAVEIVAPDWTLPEFTAIATDVSELVYEAFPEFYSLFSDSRALVVAGIAEQIQNPATEVGMNRVLLVDNSVAGVYTYIPSREAAKRQLVSLRHLLRLQGLKIDAAAHATQFGRGVEPVPREGALWTRLAVSPRYRGLGFGTRLSHALIQEVTRQGYERLFSHVHRENTSSLALHARLGFSRLGAPKYTHVALVLALR